MKFVSCPRNFTYFNLFIILISQVVDLAGMTLIRKLKHFVIKEVNRLASRAIGIINLRETLSEVTIVYPTFAYTPDLSRMKADRTDYFWMSFAQLPVDPLFYQRIDHALIVGNGIVLNPNGKVVLESTLFQKEYLFRLSQNHLILAAAFKKKVAFQKTMVCLSNVLEDNYYHWIMESITRMLLVEEVTDVHEVLIIVNDHERNFKADSLAFLFGISSSSIRQKPVRDVYFGHVLVPSFTHTRNASTRMTDLCHPMVIRKLNQRISEKLNGRKSGNLPSRFIVSRRKARDRKILNEEYLLQSLHDKNFELIQTDELPFEQQARLFFQADVIIATHGAGLTNVVCSRSVVVIELFPYERNPRDAFIFTQISSALGLEHHLLTYTSYNDTQDVMIDAALAERINSIIAE